MEKEHAFSLADAHCHLQDLRLSEELEPVLERARRAGIRAMYCCGTREEDWQGVLELSEKHADIHPSFGIHPWYADKTGERWLARLEDLIRNTPSGVGEIGLDHALTHRNDKEQAEVFRAQLDLAKKYRRPVSIHCRKAWGALLQILEEEGGLSHGGLIHSYSGSPEMVPLLEKLGCHISFSGTITRSRNKRGHASCVAVSPHRLLIETDSPDLLPVSVKGEYNEPANLVRVLTAVSRLRNMPEKELGEITAENAARLFQIRS